METAEFELTSPAQARARKKAAETSVVRLLPKFLQACTWGHSPGMQEVATNMAGILDEQYPAVAKSIREQYRFQHRQAPKQLPESLISLEDPRHGLHAVILSQETIEKCHAIVQEHSRSEELKAFGLAPRHKVLLHGAPGNGKTMLAEALAWELHVPFLRVKYSGLIDSHLGETGKKLDMVMDYAKTAPCVLFLDEFDAVGLARGEGSDVGEMRRITNQLLIAMERLPSTCVFVAATNAHNMLDAAVKRRFDFAIELASPTTELKLLCAQMELAPALTPGHDLLHLCGRISERSSANLFEVVELCRRIRRDLVLNAGEGIQTIIEARSV
ncbi:MULTISPECIES: AAA family ATPase [Polaromonas]|uniref:AAA family ATPase n=1 Tax=Polaromonas aquatica TaxID=332657 RepID=A0ABW1TZN0_9BURK